MREALTPSTLIAGAAVLLGLVLLVFPGIVGGPPEPGSIAMGRAAGAVIAAVGLWSTGAVPPYFASLIFMGLAVALSIAPPAVVFSGFHSSAVWLVFGGIVLGLAVRSSGLGDRLVQTILRRFPVSYRGLLYALALTGLALSFVIPSAAGRVLILMPIVLAVGDRLGFDATSNGRAGLVMAAGLGTMIPAFGILPANVPNVALSGAAESIYGVTFTYGEYLLLNFPVIGGLSAVAVPELVYRIFPATPRERGDAEPVGVWTPDERKLLAVLAVSLALWATDFWHGVSPAWVAMAAAIVIMLPRVGVLPATVIANKLDYGPWIFVAGIIGLGAVVNETGLGAALAREIFSVVPLEGLQDGALGGFASFAAMWGVGAGVSVLTTLPAAPGILTPLAQGMADASGWPLKSVLMTQVPVWVVFALPYQAPPVVVAMTMGGIGAGRALRVMLPWFVFSALVILPLQYLWGRLLGVFP